MSNKKNKVLIFTEGGRDNGFGHITRCIGLYEGFKSENFDVEIIVNGDETIDFLLKGVKYKKFDWLKELNFKELEKNVKVIVIDSYQAPLQFYEKISQLVEIPLYIDDYKRLEYPRGIIVNPSIYGETLNYKPQKNSKYLLGRKFIILRKKFWNVKKKIGGKEIKNILITFGGTNKKVFIEELVTHLTSNFNYKFFIIDPFKEKLSIVKILTLMLKADLCISGGGQTTYELARIGVPTIGICFSENQLNNLKFGDKYGYLKFCGWFNEKSIFENIIKIIKELNYKTLKKMSNAGRRFIDGKGVRRIIKEICLKI